MLKGMLLHVGKYNPHYLIDHNDILSVIPSIYSYDLQIYVWLPIEQ